MTRLPPKTLTITVDTREKPRMRVQFPAHLLWYGNGSPTLVTVRAVCATMETADYGVTLGEQVVAVVERKGSMAECQTNWCSRDRRRLLREWVRIARIPYRALLLDFPTADLFRTTDAVADARRLLDLILKDCGRYGLELLHLPPGETRVRTGEFLARWFLSCLQRYQEHPRSKRCPNDHAAAIRSTTTPNSKRLAPTADKRPVSATRS